MYRVTIHGNGDVVYDGRLHVREHGKRTSHVDPSAVCQLLERAARSFRQFWEYEGTLSLCKDDPTGTLFLEGSDQFAGIELSFTADKSCRPKGFPPDVVDLAAAIDALAGTQTWVECRDASGKRVSCEMGN